MAEIKKLAGVNVSAYDMTGVDTEKIIDATNKCILVMGDLTIEESKLARKHLDYVMERMYKRSPDTLINTIQLTKEYNPNTHLGRVE